MNPAGPTGVRWELLLAAAADADFREIVRWTAGRFGEAHARLYAETLAEAIEALVSGPSILGAKARDDIGKGIHSLHVARNGHRGRHLVMFRTSDSPDRPRIEILRLLHDAMDFPMSPTRHR